MFTVICLVADWPLYAISTLRYANNILRILASGEHETLPEQLSSSTHLIEGNVGCLPYANRSVNAIPPSMSFLRHDELVFACTVLKTDGVEYP